MTSNSMSFFLVNVALLFNQSWCCVATLQYVTQSFSILSYSWGVERTPYAVLAVVFFVLSFRALCPDLDPLPPAPELRSLAVNSLVAWAGWECRRVVGTISCISLYYFRESVTFLSKA